MCAADRQKENLCGLGFPTCTANAVAFHRWKADLIVRTRYRTERLRGRVATISSPVSEVQLVEPDGVRRLLIVAVHLVIDGDSPPSWCGVGTIRPVESVGLSV